MRVISGKYKGRKLSAPAGLNTRPTLDRAKETLFNIIADRLSLSRVLDLFAGSGQLGIECLSRGATEAVFADSSYEAIACIWKNTSLFFPQQKKCFSSYEAIACIWKNTSFVEEKIKILHAMYPAVLKMLDGTFDVVLLDPPFKAGLYCDILQSLQREELLSDGATVVCECDIAEKMPERVDKLVLEKQRKAGSTVMYCIYRKEEK